VLGECAGVAAIATNGQSHGMNRDESQRDRRRPGEPARRLAEQLVNDGAAERSQDGVNTVDGGDSKGGSCGGWRALARGEADEVTAHRSDWHRDSQAGDRARDEVADHDRRARA
jgi:hypothetical protein